MAYSFRDHGNQRVSPLNLLPEITGQFHFPGKIIIHDATLRSGEQRAGIVFSKEDKVAIAKRLDEAGVHRIEAGCPVTSPEDASAIREICSLGLNADIYGFVRGVPADVDAARDCGVDGVIVEVPSSEHMLRDGLGWEVSRAVDAAAATTQYAHELGLKVTFYPADGSRADIDFLTAMLLGIIENGGHMDSVTLVDTMGVLSPEGAALMTRQLLARVGVPVEVHFHEDFGLSLPNTIAALKAGAFCAHVTIDGIGERAGCCPLEPLVKALKYLYGQDTGVTGLIHV